MGQQEAWERAKFPDKVYLCIGRLQQVGCCLMPTITNWVTNIRKLKNALWNAEVKAQRVIEHQTQIKHNVHVCLARQGKK